MDRQVCFISIAISVNELVVFINGRRVVSKERSRNSIGELFEIPEQFYIGCDKELSNFYKGDILQVLLKDYLDGYSNIYLSSTYLQKTEELK